MNLRDFAREKPCLLRIPGICTLDKKETVLCHIKRGWVGHIKPPDVCAVWGCFACHDVIDGRNTHHGYTREALDSIILRALCQQLAEYMHLGVLLVVNP